ncbi:flagellar hook-basal body protein [Aquibacillus salsiterrae]|uniref:Flagellar hook-basal body protein n=1 Tax=Aquibacillus salsiterrae TaxID=2950439 RepID=A0A9X3WEG1_9BACI|nr:flagellar hook-basal body protein [Aquibacillus salsiterrae]MDC3416715.1 flagellar hook-basal body protein [Aquibacillus salsiterrae]
MLRGYYTAAAGMLAQQRRQETLSNNIANALTPGYKADQATLKSFPELLINKVQSKQISSSKGVHIPMMRKIGSLNTGVYVQETIPDFSQGALKETGMTTDMAIVGGVMPDDTGGLFFTVQNAGGDVRYTRNGNFTVDGQGFLTTQEGYYVLDARGNRIATDGEDFTVTADGTVQLAGGNVNVGVAYSANANDLVKNGESLYQLAEGGELLVDARANNAVTFSVKQNYLESSNVDPNRAMTEMMQAYRVFESNQSVLKAYDQSMEKAVNEIARLR